MQIAQVANRIRERFQRRGKSKEDAEDLAQEAFLKFYAYGQNNEVKEPEGFLTRTATNLAIDAARRARRAPFSSEPLEGFDDLSDPYPEPDEVLLAQLRMRRLKEGLSALPERTRTILLAQRLDGLTYAEIARNEGISTSAVEKHIARAIQFLLNWMDGW